MHTQILAHMSTESKLVHYAKWRLNGDMCFAREETCHKLCLVSKKIFSFFKKMNRINFFALFAGGHHPDSAHSQRFTFPTEIWIITWALGGHADLWHRPYAVITQQSQELCICCCKWSLDDAGFNQHSRSVVIWHPLSSFDITMQNILDSVFKCQEESKLNQDIGSDCISYRFGSALSMTLSSDISDKPFCARLPMGKSSSKGYERFQY